jgi:hypothetical protein
MLVEIFKLLSRYPEFLMITPANGLHFKTGDILIIDLKPCYIAPAVRR